MYLSFLRPLLGYGVWSNCTIEQSNTIESIQLEAARIVIGATQLCAIAILYQDLQSWQKLSERRKYHKLALFYKMNNNLVPNYLL
jgi:hypothetical protein